MTNHQIDITESQVSSETRRPKGTKRFRLGIFLVVLVACLGGLFTSVQQTFAAVVSVDGTVYQTDGSTVFNCSVTNLTIRVKVAGAGEYTTTCNSVGGTYSVSGVTVTAGNPLTIYIDGATQKAATFTVGTNSNLTGIDLYQDRAATRCDNSCSLTNANIDSWDGDNDSDILARVNSSALTIDAAWKLRVQAQTFAPGGTVTTTPGGVAAYAGDIEIKSGATLTMGTNALSVGGSFINMGTVTASPSAQITTFTATSAGKTITSGGTAWRTVIFNGVGGEWTLQDAFTSASSGTAVLTMTEGTLRGTQNVTIYASSGGVTGTNGIIHMTGGTFAIPASSSSSFGPAAAPGTWIFNNLTFSVPGVTGRTITATGGGTITVNGQLKIGENTDIVATTVSLGAKTWNLNGTTGTPFALLTSPAAVLTAATSTVVYAGNNGSGNTTVAGVTYNSLTLNNAAETYVLGGTITVGSDLTITAGTLDVDSTGNYGVTIRGSYANSGTFNAHAGTVTFSTGIGKTLAGNMTGSSAFYNLTFTTLNSAWSLSNDIEVLNDWMHDSGTITGMVNILVKGNVGGAGGGTQTFTGGTFEQRVSSSKNFGTTGGSGNRTYNNLVFSNASASPVVITTQSGGTGSIFVLSILSLGKSGDVASTELNADARSWLLRGDTGTPFVILSSPAAIFTAGTSIFSYTGNNASGDTTITATSYGSLTLNNVSETFVLGGDIAVTSTSASALNVLAGTLAGTNNITVAGGAVGAGGTINLTGGTFEMRAATGKGFGSTSSSAPWTFYNLVFSNADPVTPLTYSTSPNSAGPINVSNTLLIGKSGDTAATGLDANNRVWTLGGTSGAPLTLLSSPAATFTPGTSTVVYAGNNGSGNTTITPITYYNLTLDNALETFVLSADLTVTQNLTVTNGLLTGTQNITVGNDVLGTSGTITMTGGTFEQRVSANARFMNASATGTNWTFYDLVFSNATASSLSITQNALDSSQTEGNVIVTHTMQVGRAGDVGATVLALADTREWHLTGTTGTPLTMLASPAAEFSGAYDSVFTYAGNNPSGSTTIASTTYPGHLVFDNAAETFVMNGTVTARATVRATAGTLTGTGDLTIERGILSETTGVIAMTGGTVDIHMFGSSPDGTASFRTVGSTANWTFYNLMFSNSSTEGIPAVTNGGSGTITVLNTLQIGKSGDSIATILDAGDRTWILAGSTGTPISLLSSPVASLSADVATFIFTGNNVSGTTTIPATRYHEVTLNNASETYLLAGEVTVTGDLTITAGTLDVSGQNYALTIGGNYVNSGTFSAQNGTVTVNGGSPQSLSGSLTGSSAFYNLTLSNSAGINPSDNERTSFVPGVVFADSVAATGTYTIVTPNARVQYANGKTYTFNAINWNGQSVSTPIYFRNSSTNGAWNMSVSGTQQSVAHLNVSRSNAGSGSVIKVAPNTSVNAGNNINWNFVAPNTPLNLAQGNASTGSNIAANGYVTTTAITFRGTLKDGDGAVSGSLCVEAQPIGTEFTGSEECSSSTTLAAAGSVVTLNRALPANQSYHWRARSKDVSGYASAWVVFGDGVTPDFTIDTTPPTAPGTPTTETPTATTQPTWTWTASTDASMGGVTSYLVEWSEYSDFSTTLGTATVTGLSFKHPTPLNSGIYYFRVAATDAIGNISDWSTGSVAIVFLPVSETPAPPSVPSTTPEPDNSEGGRQVPLLFRINSRSMGVTNLYSFTTTQFPISFYSLAAAFPKLGTMLMDIGITRPSQLGRLRENPLDLSVPVNTTDLPQNVIFVRIGSSSMLTTQLSLNSQGEPVFIIPLLFGQPASFYVRPDQVVTSITGDLLLTETDSDVKASLGSLQFTDKNGDGVYVSSGQEVAVSGTYALQAILTYEAKGLASRPLETITVIDPEGYIYEMSGGRQIRVSNATVTLMALNAETNEYEPWEAQAFGQSNPQLTLTDGQYAFLVPEGTYKLHVEADGYMSYESSSIAVKEGQSIHEDIQLKALFSWEAILVWLGGCAILVGVLWLIWRFFGRMNRL